MDYTQLSEKLVKFLDLKYEPVAVKVVKKGERIPEGYQEPEIFYFLNEIFFLFV